MKSAMEAGGKPVTNETVLRQLNWRYATKAFDSARKIPAEDWATLEEALILSPSSYGLQPWRFIVVTDAAVREKLVAASWGQRQVVDASHLVVLAVKKNLDAACVQRYIDRIAEVRGVPVAGLDGFKQMMLGSINGREPAAVDAWSSRQVYIALGQFMAAAAMLGIDTCPMEGFEPAKYDQILGLTEQGYAAVVLCPAGYRAANDKSAVSPKVRFKSQDVIARV